MIANLLEAVLLLRELEFRRKKQPAVAAQTTKKLETRIYGFQFRVLSGGSKRNRALPGGPLELS